MSQDDAADLKTPQEFQAEVRERLERIEKMLTELHVALIRTAGTGGLGH
jgi:hypothetical protein